MCNSNARSHVGRAVRRWIVGLVLALAACVDQALPTEPALEARMSVTEQVTARAADEVGASLADAVDRIMPALDDADVPPGLRGALERIADGFAHDDPGSARAEIARAEAAIDAHPMAALPGVASEIEAIGLALAAARRAL
jgi:hypothetical protein